MYKVWVKAVGESSYNTNALEFDTIENANNYGNDLLGRWFGADSFEVLPVSPEFVGRLDKNVVVENKV